MITVSFCFAFLVLSCLFEGVVCYFLPSSVHVSCKFLGSIYNAVLVSFL